MRPANTAAKFDLNAFLPLWELLPANPLATEYAIKLIHLIPETTAEQVGAYFGFETAETSVLLQDILDTGLVTEVRTLCQLTPPFIFERSVSWIAKIHGSSAFYSAV